MINLCHKTLPVEIGAEPIGESDTSYFHDRGILGNLARGQEGVPGQEHDPRVPGAPQRRQDLELGNVPQKYRGDRQEPTAISKSARGRVRNSCQNSERDPDRQKVQEDLYQAPGE